MKLVDLWVGQTCLNYGRVSVWSFENKVRKMAVLFLQSLLIYQFAVYVYPEAVVEYEQRWAEDLGWCVAVTPLLLGVVLGALHALLMGEGSISEVSSA